MSFFPTCEMMMVAQTNTYLFLGAVITSVHNQFRAFWEIFKWL